MTQENQGGLVPHQFNSDESLVVTTSVVGSATQATEVATTHQNFLGEVLGVGSSLTATGVWEHGDKIVAGIKFALSAFR